MEPLRILRVLAEQRVEHVLIGGLAAVAHGATRLTDDADVCFSQREASCRRLAAALAVLEARIVPPRDPPIELTAPLLAGHRPVHLGTPAGRLDLVADVPGLGPYEALFAGVDRIRLAELQVPVLSLDQLIRAKGALDTAKDRDHLDQLLALRRLRDERGS